VDLKIPAEQVSFSIIDASGMVVKAPIPTRANADKLEFLVNQLQPGLYTLLVKANNSQQVLRFLKKIRI
jgi:hypothetical protein